MNVLNLTDESDHDDQVGSSALLSGLLTTSISCSVIVQLFVFFRITRRRHDAEHHQLPVADLRPAGSGSHGQRLPRQTQGRNQQNRSLTGHWAGHWAGHWRVTERVTDGSEWRRSLILSGSLNNTSRLESNQEPQDRPVIRVKTNECKNTELWIWCH